ncbi:winged helix-turn-helix domain-containing protein [Micromonospora sp. CPCC 205371]|nr:winged helix-turn-helix domain-containing protein [Micromonospora sp. CPCC 205371]
MLEWSVLRIEFAPADLAGLRFAHSPMVEVVASGFALHQPRRHWMASAWRDRVRPRLTGVDTFLTLLRGPTCYVPDFLTPVPATARPSLDDELRTIAGTPLDRVAAEVAAGWTGHRAPPEITRFETDPAGALAELIAQIRRYFRLAIAPIWPRLRATAEGEIAHRALAAAEHGPRALLAGLHPKLSWDGSALLLGYAKSHDLAHDGSPLALMPAAFAGPMVYATTGTPSGRALWYPPRGYASLWSSPSPAPPAALAALLGPTRAAVLTLLAVPSSTGEVAEALHLAPATASHHLTTLRDAGLIVGQRTGRRLRYLRTTLGEQLAS